MVFEGLDGAGKSKQSRAFFQRLRRRGAKAILTREPGGTSLGRRLRRLIVDGRYPVTSEAELLLIAAARAQVVHEVVRPWLAQGGIVVSDRYTPSTWAYQGAGRGLPSEDIAASVAMATDGLEPDLVVLLDVPPSIGLKRKGKGSGSTLSRFETEPLEFTERVRRSYLDQAAAQPDRWLVLNAELPPRVLSDQIWTACQPFLEYLRQKDIALRG